MKPSYAILLSVAVLAIAAVIALPSGRPFAQTSFGYQLADGGGTGLIWRIDSTNGRVSQCRIARANEKPVCSPWSD